MFKEARTSSNRCLARLHAAPIVMPHTPEAQLLQSTDRPADVILTGSMSLPAYSYHLTGVNAHRDSTFGLLQPENHRTSHCTQPHPLCVPFCVPFCASRFKLSAYDKTWHTVFSTTTFAQPGLSKVSVRSRSLPHLHVHPNSASSNLSPLESLPRCESIDKWLAMVKFALTCSLSRKWSVFSCLTRKNT